MQSSDVLFGIALLHIESFASSPSELWLQICFPILLCWSWSWVVTPLLTMSSFLVLLYWRMPKQHSQLGPTGGQLGPNLAQLGPNWGPYGMLLGCLGSLRRLAPSSLPLYYYARELVQASSVAQCLNHFPYTTMLEEVAVAFTRSGALLPYTNTLGVCVPSAVSF